MRSGLLRLLLAVGVAGITASAMGLEIGDVPPPLSISEWVNGEPVDLSKELGKKVLLVEFWATWCPPCKVSIPRLTRFQNQYAKDLKIIGVTAVDDRGNHPRAIRRFVKDQGSNMSYIAAIDDGLKTWGRYMGDQMGIPHCFVIARNGKVAWQGSPLEPALDEVIPQVIAGTFDVEKAKSFAEVNRKLEEMNFAIQIGQWSAVWDLSVGILQLDPAHDIAMGNLLGLYLDGLKNEDEYRRWAQSHISKHRDNALAMQNLAKTLCANPDITKRTPALALEAARAAYESPNGRGPHAIAAFARALYQIGEIDRAIKLQEEAVTAATGNEEKAELERGLEYYKECRELRASLH